LVAVKCVEQRPAGFAFEAREPKLKSRLGPAIRGCRDRPRLVRATEVGERFTHDRERPSRLAGFVLIVDCQLLVRFVALARVSQRAFPKLARAREVPVAPCQPRECRASSTIGFHRQDGGNRLFVQFARTL